MPVNLSIKNVPDELAELLRARARLNHRSLQRELMAILESVAHGGSVQAQAAAAPSGERISIEQLAARAHELFPKGTPSSTDFIRQSRDGRYGADWARTGRQPARR